MKEIEQKLGPFVRRVRLLQAWMGLAIGACAGGLVSWSSQTQPVASHTLHSVAITSVSIMPATSLHRRRIMTRPASGDDHAHRPHDGRVSGCGPASSTAGSALCGTTGTQTTCAGRAALYSCGARYEHNRAAQIQRDGGSDAGATTAHQPSWRDTTAFVHSEASDSRLRWRY